MNHMVISSNIFLRQYTTKAANEKGIDQSVGMLRLNCTFVVRKCKRQRFLMLLVSIEWVVQGDPGPEVIKLFYAQLT